jgi:hypothetical protein
MVGYTSNPATVGTDLIRLLIGDTDNADLLLLDAEVTYFYNAFGAYLGAVRACEAIAAKFSREVNSSLGELSESAAGKAQAYSQRATELMQVYMQTLSGTSITIPTSISKVRDSVPGNYPTRQEYTDIQDQVWGHEDEDYE